LQAAGSDELLPPFSSVSRPQKLVTPTFQVPSSYTAVPFWFFSSGVPDIRMEYVTWASEEVITVTLVTCAVACEARPEPAWDLMIEEKSDPSCSRPTRVATGVFALKKAAQLAAITFASPVAADGVDGAADAAGAAGDEGDAAGVVLLLLLPHAARPRPAMHASRIEEINLRVITQSFSSFLLALATLILTLTSACRRGRARKSAILAGPAHNPGTAAAAAV